MSSFEASLHEAIYCFSSQSGCKVGGLCAAGFIGHECFHGRRTVGLAGGLELFRCTSIDGDRTFASTVTTTPGRLAGGGGG